VKTILVVDDSPTVRMLMAKVLAAEEYHTVLCEDGEHALRCVDEHVPDAILSDLSMPGMDGIELLRRLRSRPALVGVPIFILTTESQVARRQEAREAGATGWMVKPVRARALADVLKRVTQDA